MKRVIFLLFVSLLFSGCASIFLPKKQKVVFVTNHADSKVYADKEEIGSGKIFTARIAKEGRAKQIVVKTPGYKDTYAAIVPSRRQTAYWFLQIPNPIWLGYVGFFADAISPKNMGYQKAINIPVNGKLVYRGEKDKYVDISGIGLDINNKDKDIRSYSVRFSEKGLEEKIKEAEKKTDDKTARDEAKKEKKKNKRQPEDVQDKEIKYDDTKFSYNVYKTLKHTGFVDTVNRFFSDYNNSVYLEGNIHKLNIYTIVGKRFGYYNRCKVFLTWYVKNNFGELLDSVVTSEYSGDFVLRYYYSMYASREEIERIKNEYQEQVGKMFGDAIDISYLNLHKNPAFTKYLRQETDFAIKDPLLIIPEATAYVADKLEAGGASVIVKTKDGHGSGFAISQDGYVITNYHVVASRNNNQPNSVTIVNQAGEEMPGTVVRYNKFRDVALIKTNAVFEKPFKITTIKSFKNLQDVFTIGAPKSIELGQTISTGIISNERKANNNNLLQLNMGINSGNSGGPVFDDAGTLHGVIVSKAIGKNTEGIGFAIPGYLLEEYLNISFAK